MHALRDRAETFQRSGRVLGWVPTVRTYLANAIRPPKDDHDPEFDKINGTDTSEVIDELAALAFPASQLDDARGYQGAHVGATRNAIAAVPLDPGEAEFWDLGSGKGRAVLVAAEAGFARSVGVELATPLHERAIANAAIMAPRLGSGREIDFLNISATDVTWPERPLVVFLFNPFVGETLDRVVASLAIRAAASEEPLFVIYLNPEQRHVFDRSPAFTAHAELPVNPPFWSSVVYRGLPATAS